jgi:uncharacterized protein (DUF1330 family)
MAIVPNEKQFAELASNPDPGPVVMLNLIKFSDAVEYGRYGESALKMVEQRGGRLLWHGKPQQTLVGEADWDYVALVEYPSRKAFIDMVTDREYRKAHEHREAGVDHTVLLACGSL